MSFCALWRRRLTIESQLSAALAREVAVQNKVQRLQVCVYIADTHPRAAVAYRMVPLVCMTLHV